VHAVKVESCVCCGGRHFEQRQVLWAGLVAEWGLAEDEARYIDRQQGYVCVRCGSNLRSMALAHAIQRAYRVSGTFRRLAFKRPWLRILEVNPAGQLTQFLRLFPRHRLVSYPDVDLMALPFDDDTFDLVVHSDTLEHVPDPVRGLAESRRVLRPGGYSCYTVPIVVARKTVERGDRAPSYHGASSGPEHRVYTEYGVDAWTQAVRAGFAECRIVALEYPAGLALTAVKR
jgi:SAM-dependent methyltransferase